LGYCQGSRGSSGGSAAPPRPPDPFATGTDTGGSIRQPAALTGVTGFKPTYGRVSRFGLIAFASSLDQAGVFARSAADAAAVLQAMAGFDPRDSTSVDVPVPDYSSALSQPLKGMKIVCCANSSMGWSRATRPARGRLNIYTGLGAETLQVSLPHLPLSVRLTMSCAGGVFLESVALRRRALWLPLRESKRSHGFVQALAGRGLWRRVKRRIMTGTYVLSAGYFDAYYLKAQKARRLITDDFRAAFDKVDLVIGPPRRRRPSKSAPR